MVNQSSVIAPAKTTFTDQGFTTPMSAPTEGQTTKHDDSHDILIAVRNDWKVNCSAIGILNLAVRIITVSHWLFAVQNSLTADRHRHMRIFWPYNKKGGAQGAAQVCI